MKKLVITLLSLALFNPCSLSAHELTQTVHQATRHSNLTTNETIKPTTALYERIFKRREVSFSTFQQSINAYNRTQAKNPKKLIIVDYSKSSSKKRFFVIDMIKRKIEFETYVAHAKSSGWRYASHFSNRINSSESAIGRFKTAKTTYYGKNGLSIRVIGLDKGVNDNTYKRNIVIHGSLYVGEKWMRKHNGFQGRSLGCFAIPHSVYLKIIPTIKDGVVMFVHK
ncbi:murein L,D-transpeptidase catalytic domain family protein [Photobacterium damselae]|uniref:murein L,D-transpeptidase catalytic domain family protein n=1 Tax=Photobacterium damselae TaxID=38293 RepID=UPI0040694C84